MTDEDQIVALAELDGFTNFRLEGGLLNQKLCGQLNGTRFQVPDYLNDLNAVHRLVKAQPFSVRLAYHNALPVILGGPIKETVATRECIDATARQRCEAILRARGKWKDANA